LQLVLVNPLDSVDSDANGLIDNSDTSNACNGDSVCETNEMLVNGNMTVNGNITLGGDSPTYRVRNVAMPIEDSDVATKGYVDAQVGGGGGFKIMKDVCSCLIGYMNPCSCTASVDCGDGWQIIKGGTGTCLSSDAPIWAEGCAQKNAGMGYAGIIASDGRQASSPISFGALGSQTANVTTSGGISYNSAGAAIVVLCAKKS